MKPIHQGLLFAATVVAMLLLWANIFTDRHSLPRYEALLGAREAVVVRRLGPPLMQMHGADDAAFPVRGHRKPRTTQFAKAFVYQLRYGGLVYMFFDGKGNVKNVEYAGG